MLEHRDRAGRTSAAIVAGICRHTCRLGMIAFAAGLIVALDLARLPLLETGPGAQPAFAKNDRSSERSQGGRGHGNGNRGVRSHGGDAGGGDGGRRIWNRPRDSEHAGRGGHWERTGSGGGAERSDRWATVAPAQPPVPPRRPEPAEQGFRNHGDRVSTFVTLAKELGFNASVGAMQANFGTPFENGLVATDPATGEFLKDPDTGEFIIHATDAEIAAVKPGNGPRTGWETETDLDVNMDGVVDDADLDAARDPVTLSDGDVGGGAGDDHGQTDGRPADEDNHGGGSQSAILRLGREDGETAL